jgi:ketosteroid isomerase-like protein
MSGIKDKIIALERGALEGWGKGDPNGYLELYAPDVTYFDPFTPSRLDGYAAMDEHYRPVHGTIWMERMELLNPQVLAEGQTAILTYNLVDPVRVSDPSGTKESRWNVTEVYRCINNGWKIVHSHFSLTGPPPSAA